MGDANVEQYWCHLCCRVVTPVTDAEIKCPLCETGFVEEIGDTRELNNNAIDQLGSERTLSRWAPILLGLMGGLTPSGARVMAQERITNNSSPQEDDELERNFESMFRQRRRRNSASILRVLQDLQTGSQRNVNNIVESSNNNNGSSSNSSNGSSVILVNPLYEDALVLPSPYDMNRSGNPTQSLASSFADYLFGPGLELLLRHLSENDPNRYGTPPAQKEAVIAMPNVTIEENLQCPVCLEEFVVGDEAKEMPCKHKFHGECILPWLELHSSCPVCRFQMPSDDSKTETNSLRSRQERMGNTDARTDDGVGDGQETRENRRGHMIPISWPFDGLFSLPGSQSSGSSNSASSAETRPGSSAHSDET
ncbi:hypothetical protein K2173_025595 [Erythroxylum novogranatense]|uniref:RING-type E3 ubiquitin transferase n=1 Tax=Erythroxylum novogranatense TaxID=1862640 RepID=A0AAV8T8X8_9ROSI|nr:hypothetical protein K2173_025595 [Erythroxylum novogranatense]